MSELKNRYDFVYVFDVKDGNPNGDPDAGNLPRIDNETGMGLVTDVCLKRKVRNYVDTIKKGEPKFDIFIQEAAVLDKRVEDIYAQEVVKVIDDKQKDKRKAKAQQLLCEKYYDIRTFGAVIATKEKQGQVRGPIQLTFARSVDPIISSSHAITRMAVTKEADKDKEKTIGRKSTVSYGLYVCYGFVSASLASQTGFDSEDLDLLWEALENMFDFDRSASHGLMAARKLIVFKHDSQWGNIQAHKLFDAVKIHKKDECSIPRSFEDYAVTIDETKIPENVTVEELL